MPERIGRFCRNTSAPWTLIASAVMFLVLAVSFQAAMAESPFKKLVVFRGMGVDADPDKRYELTEENGPWTILAITFSGEHAQQDADELVYELRKRYKLDAYTHRMSFDFTGLEQGRGFDPYGNVKVMKHNRSAVVNEVAVLVGDYDQVDDHRAQKVLKRLKKTTPETLQEEGAVSRPLAGLRDMQRQAQALLRNEKQHLGPMGHAFLTPNPLLGKEYFAPKGVDKFVEEINQDFEFSLLNCPGKYTLKLATYTGSKVVDPKRIREITEQGHAMESQLVQAAENAHRLTLALRKKGYEAYEFHDRDLSIVAVGSFESPGEPQPDGTVRHLPQVESLFRAFSADSNVDLTGQATQGPKPKIIDGIPLDVRPKLIEVPKRSFSSDYGRTAQRMR